MEYDHSIDRTRFPVSYTVAEDGRNQELVILGVTLRKSDRTLPVRSSGAQIERDHVTVGKAGEREQVLRPRDGAYPRARISRPIGGLIKKFRAGAKLAPHPRKTSSKVARRASPV